MKITKYFSFVVVLFVALQPTPVLAQDDDIADPDKPKNERKETARKKYSTREIKGLILDATTRQPLAGALVSADGVDGYSVLSGSDGSYTLNVPLFSSCVVITAPGHNMMKMGLVSEVTQKDVFLYTNSFNSEYETGTNVTASVSTSDFRFAPSVSIEDEIQMRLGAQVHTTMRNGTPGIGGVMMIGGLNSLNVNAQPLIIIDGVIFDQQYSRTPLHDGFYNDILTNVSPSDIEKVTVLRNGTALYGAKGANGVILIETKRNKSMATRITASISAGVTLEPKYFDMMDATQYKSYASDLLATLKITIKDFKFLNESPTYYYYSQYHNDTDWKDYVYRTAITQNYGINVMGGDEIADYNLSLGYITNQSTLKQNKMNRLNIRFNSDIRLTQQFDIRFDASFANQTRNLRNDGAPENYTEGTPTSTAFLAYAKSPMLSPWTFANGQIRDGYIDVADESYLDEALAEYSNYNYKLANPLAINEYGEAENKNHFENSMVNLSVTPKYRLGQHLALSEHFSYNLVNTNEKYYIPMNGVPSYYVAGVNAYCDNEVRSMASKQNSVMSDTRLDYENRFDRHYLNVFGGVRYNSETYTLSEQLGYNTGSDKMPAVSSSLDHSKPSGGSDKWKSIAWYLHANYNYLQRYYLQANLSLETSSRFGNNADQAVRLFEVPWGFFHGVQAAWVLSNESWLAGIKGVDYLRLSLGYDFSGNDDIDYHAARSYFSSNNFLEDVSGLSFENIGNNHLQWEVTKRLNMGIEGNFFDNRLNLRVNYFRSTTDHLLMYQKLGYVTGLSRNWTNDGSMDNQGFDVTAIGKVLALKDFQWELGVNIGHYKNKITELADNQIAIDNTLYGATIRTAVGQAANMFYGYKTLGIFSTSEEAASAGLYILDANGVDRLYFGAGDMHFADIDGDHQITEADREFIGDPNPDIYGNIFTSLAYKRWKMDVNLNYCVGNDVYNYQRSQLESGSRFMNQTTAMTRRWQTEGQLTDMPRITFQDPLANGRFSDRWIEDGSYLKLKSITLSYDLPMHSTLLQGFQFWIQANNVLTLSKYLGADPEFAMTGRVIGQGIDLGCLPQSRSFVAGVKINL